MNADSLLVQSALESGEQVLWTGRPNPSRIRSQNYAIALLGLFALVLADFWIETMGKMDDFFAPPLGLVILSIFLLGIGRIKTLDRIR